VNFTHEVVQYYNSKTGGKNLGTSGNYCLNLEPGETKLKCIKFNWLHCVECCSNVCHVFKKFLLVMKEEGTSII